MNDMSRHSLLERAAERYAFDRAFRGAAPGPMAAPAPASLAPDPAPMPPRWAPEPATAAQPGCVAIDRERLAAASLLVPRAAVTQLAEEFRQVKRQLLLEMRGITGARARVILVASPNAGEGKTWCALNLALSLSVERDTEVLLIDADVAKPDVMGRLGLSEGPGLLDALAHPDVEAEALVRRTDVPQLSLLPAGTARPDATELLASERLGSVLDALAAADLRRILIFDTPPVLAASPAATLALQAGQIVIVVRADRTSEGSLKEAVSLLDVGVPVSLVLNGVSFAAPGASRYGAYGQEEA